MTRLVVIILYWCSLAITLTCAIAAVTISAAIVTGKLADPEAWIAAVLFATVAGSFWLLCRAAKDFSSDQS